MIAGEMAAGGYDLRAELEQAKSEIARQPEQMTSPEATIAGRRTTKPAAASESASLPQADAA